MEDFKLQSYLEDIYSSFPEARRQPVIGITTNYQEIDACLRDRYYKQVVAAGGIPVLIPPVPDSTVIINTLELIDGLILTGGGDYDPRWADEEPSPKLGNVNAERDLPELLITRLAFNRQIPMLGICRGMQTLAMALGGKVWQDICLRDASQPSTLTHNQSEERDVTTHTVTIDKDSILYKVYGQEQMAVNSFHHQAVREAGKLFRVTATAPDGVIEAMESTEYKSILGVQWHPEWLGLDGGELFTWLVQEAKSFYQAKQIHRQVLTLDSHCDTPMFFPQGVHFEQRDPRILVDLHKMTEGRLDAVTMVAYLPQKFDEFVKKDLRLSASETEKFSPFDYANSIFDQIEQIVNDNHPYLAIARTPDELYEHKRQGRKSIMLGIENGLAFIHDIASVVHFAHRGIVYVTLCHNGDNDICDSARGCHTHHGVSPFGEQVIREMNRLGIMVDMSHAGEKSFYDALDISRQPIVCSHSNCKVLCDVPRNLTDDQLKALAAKGGVAQITLYHGFLRQEGEACIIDAITHLEHAIRIMGIDHVGLGTDFDGDGGVCGLADASELIQFTRQLLARKYSEQDIRKIWGGNWLRVMREVQGSESRKLNV